MPGYSDLEGSLQAALAGNHLLATVGLTFAAGVATSLTPCVYPMIAVTVSVFGARQTRTRAEGALLSSSFVAGMSSLFVAMGVLAARTGGLFGAALSNPLVLVGLALLFIALAASMFGAFDLDLPSGMKTALADMGGVGLRGAFVLGMVSALIAAPCTGPVLGALLTWVGSTGDLWVGVLALLAYALGLGSLFWLVGTFAIVLPKSGRWLGSVKSFFGVIMLAAAFYYLRPLLPLKEPAWLGSSSLLWGAGCALLVSGVAIGALRLRFDSGDKREQIKKGLGIALMVAGLLVVVRGFEAPTRASWAWREDFAAAQAEARQVRRPLLVDFSASWCGACGELERHMFSDPAVVREGQRFVTVRVDLSPDQDSPQKRAFLGAYAARGLPLVVLHDADGRESARVTGFVEAPRFLELMRSVQ